VIPVHQLNKQVIRKHQNPQVVTHQLNPEMYQLELNVINPNASNNNGGEFHAK
jgi:hypothetical protein